MDQRWAETLGRLFQARRSGVVLGLDRIEAASRALGEPHRRLGRVFHVGGTNGKGSTAAFCAAVCRAAGLRVATYSSPHLYTLRERLTIDGEMLAESAWQAALDRVATVGGESLTFFEQVTLAAFVLTAEAAVEVSIIEVGLGGRLDATNIIDAEIAVITGVALDHQAYLGDSLEEIAREKAGICKAGQSVIIGIAGEPLARETLLRRAREAGSEVHALAPDDLARVADWPRGLAGAHQLANAALAVRAAGTLAARLAADGAAAPDPRWRLLGERDCQRQGVAAASLPGRLELVVGGPGLGSAGTGERLLFDAAHNPDGARALASHLASLAVRPRWVVLGVSADKDAAGMLEPLLEVVDGIVCTAYAGERAMTADALASVAASSARALRATPAIEARPTSAEAVALARGRAGEGGLVCVAGSIFLVGEVRAAWLGLPRDPVTLSDPMGRPPATLPPRRP